MESAKRSPKPKLPDRRKWQCERNADYISPGDTREESCLPRIAEQARAAGVEATAHVWEGMPHVFTSSIGTLDAADQALNLMAAFVKDKLQTQQDIKTT